MRCWLQEHGVYVAPTGVRRPMPPCEGALVKAHLIPRQVIHRELQPDDAWDVIRDDRSWVWACGGIMGPDGHHGMLDRERSLRIPYHRLPATLFMLAEEHGLSWWLEREYQR